MSPSSPRKSPRFRPSFDALETLNLLSVTSLSQFPGWGRAWDLTTPGSRSLASTPSLHINPPGSAVFKTLPTAASSGHGLAAKAPAGSPGVAAPLATASVRAAAVTASPATGSNTFYPTSTEIVKRPDLKDYIIGNSGDYVLPKAVKAEGGLVMQGGGDRINPEYSWMIGRGGGGDFVVIRASDYDTYNSVIYGLTGTASNGRTVSPDSVETLIISSRDAANDPAVVAKIRNAEEVFIAGGDQSNYFNYWRGTGVESAIHSLVARGVPVGGTSAGLAVMSGWGFTAEGGTVTSKEALNDPYDHRVALDSGFLQLSPYLDNAIADMHFDTRDRMGRLVTFMARLNNPDGLATAAGVKARGFGVDENSALLMTPDGRATLIASDGQPHSAYFLSPGDQEDCEPKTALTYTNLAVHRITVNQSFDFGTWTSSVGVGTDYTISAVGGTLYSTQSGGAIY